MLKVAIVLKIRIEVEVEVEIEAQTRIFASSRSLLSSSNYELRIEEYEFANCPLTRQGLFNVALAMRR